MQQKIRSKRKPVITPKTILRVPDLEVAKSAVLNSVSCPDARRGYRHAIEEFVDWHCPEPRLSFGKTVVVRYRMHQATSTFDSERFGVSPTKLRIAGYSAPTWQPEYGESRALRSSE
jgi:hypothetical protein